MIVSAVLKLRTTVLGGRYILAVRRLYFQGSFLEFLTREVSLQLGAPALFHGLQSLFLLLSGKPSPYLCQKITFTHKVTCINIRFLLHQGVPGHQSYTEKFR